MLPRSYKNQQKKSKLFLVGQFLRTTRNCEQNVLQYKFKVWYWIYRRDIFFCFYLKKSIIMDV